MTDSRALARQRQEFLARATAAIHDDAVAGWERVTLSPGRPLRWWFYVTSGPFTFARGGRCRTEQQARVLIDTARADAVLELGEFRFRPTHVLGAGGQLLAIPDALPPELAAST